jgi:yeast amino acid transporter
VIKGYAWKRQGWKKLSEIDVDRYLHQCLRRAMIMYTDAHHSGRRSIDYEAFEKFKAKYAGWPWWRKALDKVF